MKFLFRWLFRLVILLIVLVVAAILLMDTIAREVVEYRIKKDTGLEVHIGKVELGLLNPTVTLEHVVIYNSTEFGSFVLVNLPELHVEYDRAALWGGTLHCRFVRFNLALVNIVENTNGVKNIDAFRKKDKPPGQREASGKKHSEHIKFGGIDTLNLSLGKAIFVRMKQPDKVQEINVNFQNQIFKDIKDQDDLLGVLLVALLKSGAPNWVQVVK